jgi:hypothetical protein
VRTIQGASSVSKDVNSSEELFKKIIRLWGARPDPTEPLTRKQIANLVLGSGTDENASIIGRTIVDFREYFKYDDHYRCSVRWMRIESDHPELFPQSKAAGTVSTVPVNGPLADMLQALNDEVAAVKKQNNHNPIKAVVRRSLGQIPDGGFWYEAALALPGDTELPIPEGVQIKLRWVSALHVYPCEAKLLSYDAIKSLIIFEVDKRLGETQIKNTFDLLPCVEQLIQTVIEQLGRTSQDRNRPVWRLLNGVKAVNKLAWEEGIVSDNLDPSQAAAVVASLTTDLTFLWGPPGTGKTHTLGRLMASAALAGKRVIASAISNIAVDQMALQVVRALEAAGDDGQRLLAEGRILRFGYPRDPKVSEEQRLFPNRIQIQELRRQLHDLQQTIRDLADDNAELRAKLNHQILDVKLQLRDLTKVLISKSRVVLTTAVQTCIEPAIGESPFDLAIIDEASMMPVPYVLCVGSLSPHRIVITGDFRQLGPIALSQTAAAHRWLHKDAFELAGISGEGIEHPALQMLQVQRRMHPGICDLINSVFYGGKLRSASTPKNSTNFDPLKGEPAILVELLPEDGSKVEQTPSASRLNRASAQLVASLACRLLQEDSDAIVGIIAPYRAQVTLIRRLIREQGLGKDQARRTRLGTVHAFQGSEADVIIWDLVETRDHKIGRLYHKDAGDRLSNVAISRAQGKLIFVGDPEAFFYAPGQESVGKLRGILALNFNASSRSVIRATELETMGSVAVQ